MDKENKEMKFAHVQECVHLQQQLDKQTKLASEASKQMAKLYQELEESRCNADRMRKNMANLQQNLDYTQAQLEQYSEPAKTGITPQDVSHSCVKIRQEFRIGAWGTVTRGVYYSQPVAVKLPHKMILNQHILKREIQLMTNVRRSNLLKCTAAVFENESHALWAPLMITTELLDINLRQCYEQRRLKGSNKVPIFKDVACGLHYLHDRKKPIIHKNLSAVSILLQALPAGMLKAKISDFGSTNLAPLSNTAEEGTTMCTAPEALLQTDPSVSHIPHTTKIDAFSFGILLCEVITTQLSDPEHYQEWLEQVRGRSIPLHGLIVSCTQPNPDNRLTIAQVIDELNAMPHPHLVSCA